MLGDDRSPQDAEAADAMRFGEAVFRESARLKSRRPDHLRRALADTNVAGVELPAGTRVAGAHAPSRTAGEASPASIPTAGWTGENPVFLPFGAGPRFCPGRNLAFLEAKAALAMLARNFEWELAGPPPRERFSFTMRPWGSADAAPA